MTDEAAGDVVAAAGEDDAVATSSRSRVAATGAVIGATGVDTFVGSVAGTTGSVSVKNTL